VDVVLPEVAPLEANLTYPEYPVKILDQKDRVTRCKIIKFFKVQWSNHTEEEATWERERFLRSRHLNFALPSSGVRDCSLLGGRVVTSLIFTIAKSLYSTVHHLV
jgi:hypothetical protein